MAGDQFRKTKRCFVGNSFGYFFGAGRGLFGVRAFLWRSLFFMAVVMGSYGCLVLACFLVSFFYGQIYNYYLFEKNELKPFYGERITFRGRIVSFPEFKESQTKVIVNVTQVLVKKHSIPYLNPYAEKNERMLLSVSPEILLQYGDFIEVEGKITRPPHYKDFDYSKFLKKDGIQALVRFPESVVIRDDEEGKNNILLAGKEVRDFFSRTIERALPLPHSTIAIGILLGVKKQLPEFVAQDFKQSALQHIIVVSGFNVTIVIFLLTLILQRLGRVITFLGVSFSLFFFVFMTGAEAPVVRAGLMGVCVVASVFLGRFSDVRNVFFLALVLVAVISPKTLQYDMSLFLSSAATLGIVLGTPWAERVFFFLPDRFGIRTLFSVTLAAQVAVFPLLAFYFSEISIIGLVSNLFIEPLIPLGMFFTALILLSGLFLPIIFTKIIALPAVVILEKIFWVAHFFGDYEPIKIGGTWSWGVLVLMLGSFVWGSFVRGGENEFFLNHKKDVKS